jgi:hypothetical protein
MKKVYKAPSKYQFGWNDPTLPAHKRPRPELLYKRLIEDTETGEISELTNAYLHGATEEARRILNV